MARLYEDFISGTTTTDPLLVGGTTLDGAFLADVPEVSGSDILVLVLDPEVVGNGPEIVHITAHTASATTCTILREQEGTTAAEHESGTKAIHPLTQAGIDTVVSTADQLRADFDYHHGGATTGHHPEVTTGSRGFMSAADLTKLNTIETSAKNDQTITAGTGLTGGGTGDVTISHYNTSSVGNIDCQADEHINVLGFDTYGHVITATKQTMSAADINAEPEINDMRAAGVTGGHHADTSLPNLTGSWAAITSKTVPVPSGWDDVLVIVNAFIQYSDGTNGAQLNGRIEIDGTDGTSFQSGSAESEKGMTNVQMVGSKVVVDPGVSFVIDLEAYESVADTNVGKNCGFSYILIKALG